MTRDLLTALRQLEKLFEDRLIITRIIIDQDGHEVGRIERVALNRNAEPPRRGDAPALSSIQLRALTDGVVGHCSKDGVIAVDPNSQYFGDAQRGEYLPLACVLHHEQQHQNGASERVAYLASIQFLKRNHASAALITSTIETVLRIFAPTTNKEHIT